MSFFKHVGRAVDEGKAVEFSYVDEKNSNMEHYFRTVNEIPLNGSNPVSTEERPCRHDLPAISGALQTGKAEKISKIESGGTVLLIEDEEQVRKMAGIMLTRLGYSVLKAKDGD
ncbi:MAG: response regulator [Pseudomonadota bacterium]